MQPDHNDPAEESLAQWAARRAQRRRPIGERKAITLAPGPPRATHVNPGVPRLILEWDGVQWTVATLANDYTEACRALDPCAAAETVSLPDHSPALRRSGGGRHHRTC